MIFTGSMAFTGRIGRMLALLALILLAGLPAAWGAEGLRLNGPLVQGGLVAGQAVPGSQVRLDGETVRVRADGRFLIGFGRDMGPEAVLEVRPPGGTPQIHRLRIAAQDYDIQRIEGLPPAMVTPPGAVLERIRADARQVRAARLVDTDVPLLDSGFIWPVEGRITGVYGSQRILNGEPRRPHFGIDIAAPTGTPVVAAADGIVRLAETDMYFTGGTILIDHGYGVNSVYSHLESVAVPVGAEVRKGQLIGTVGATGRSTGPHLDWRVNLFLTRLDPALLVPPMPAPASKGD